MCTQARFIVLLPELASLFARTRTGTRTRTRAREPENWRTRACTRPAWPPRHACLLCCCLPNKTYVRLIPTTISRHRLRDISHRARILLNCIRSCFELIRLRYELPAATLREAGAGTEAEAEAGDKAASPSVAQVQPGTRHKAQALPLWHFCFTFDFFAAASCFLSGRGGRRSRTGRGKQ